jgi:hypothetical protein
MLRKIGKANKRAARLLAVGLARDAAEGLAFDEIQRLQKTAGIGEAGLHEWLATLEATPE